MNVKRVFRGIFLLLFLSLAAPASAHRVNVFAWVEGDTVNTESFFSDGKKASNAQIEVFDSRGERLLSGKTDKEGMFSFKLPDKTDLKIVLHASMGHRAEFNLSGSEVMGSVEGGRSEPVGKSTSIEGAPCISKEEIQAVVEKVLDEKLRPMQKRLAQYQKRGPDITEILGGIGYIIGLMGVAIYFSHRKRGKTDG